MKSAYPNLLAPVNVGKHIYKSHMLGLPCTPPFLQGEQDYPTETVIAHYMEKARSGISSIVMLGTPLSLKVPHTAFWNIEDDFAQHYLGALTEAVRNFGTKCIMTLGPDFKDGWDVSDGIPSFAVAGDGSVGVPGREMPERIMFEEADRVVKLAEAIKSAGFDGIYMHNAYGVNLGRFLSTRYNKRTDKYGGSLENRMRYPLYMMKRIKEACGKDFIIETTITGDEGEGGGWSLEDTVTYSKALEGYADILHIRPQTVDESSTLGFHEGRTPHLQIAADVRRLSDTSVKIVALGGMHDPEQNEQLIRDGVVDFVGIARGILADPEYGKKVVENRADDIVPCLHCNKCHKSNMSDPWIPVCSVNPKLGYELRIKQIERPAAHSKKIAVIGAGPAGMKAAMTLNDRGHKVTLFEADDKMGGLLIAAGVPEFKWPINDYINYLIRQIEKRPIEVRMNTKATPEMIEAENFDTVVVCVGSQPAKPPIPGINGKNVMTTVNALLHPETLGKKLVIVGGGEIGVEAGMHFAKNGHEVMTIEMLPILAAESIPVHYRAVFEAAWLAIPEFKFSVNSKVVEIGEDFVKYVDKDGAEHIEKCDNVLVSAGMGAKRDEAEAFYGCAPEFVMMGGCEKDTNVQKLNRRVWFACNEI